MSLEEEHEAMHRRGEMIKFLVFVLVLVGTVFAIALLRPLIFERIVPAVLGWEEETGAAITPPEQPVSDEEAPAASSGDAEGETPLIMTATPSSGATEDLGAPLPTPRMYEVQAGDSLVRIAEQFGVTMEALVEANGIVDPQRIQVGDVLVIPEP